ncbi:MAG: hypothetical protein LBQ39_02010 [Tannerellaceae bacterium]|jgi:hypothetical protein|nr:hypothetical protein [Tannerellaceae bacterium]
MSEKREEVLKAWAENLIHRILKEMEVQQITPYNSKYPKGYKGKGDLKKSIDYKVWNASAGNPEMITFFYSYIGLFVETGTGKDEKYSYQKLSQPFKSGKKYYKSKHGEREPKPFISVLIKQRAFALGSISARLLAEEVNARIVSTFSRMDMDQRIAAVEKSRSQFWKILGDHNF